MRQQLIDGYTKMRSDIAKDKESYLEHIIKHIQSVKDFSEINLLIIYEDILSSLEKTYSTTAAAARKLYNIEPERLQNGEILELTYSKDGKTLYDRLLEHYNNAKDREDDKQYFINRLVLIMDTETLTVSNSILHNKLNKDAKYVEILSGSDCCHEGDCEYWISKGKMPIEELTELPPFHPDCECEIIYYFE